MRISDWSSDVCSSDLEPRQAVSAVEPQRCAGTDRWRSPQRRDDLSPRIWPCQRGARDGQHAANQNADRLDQQALHVACRAAARSEEHTSELQSLMRISYAVFCLDKKQYQDQYRCGIRRGKADQWTIQ